MNFDQLFTRSVLSSPSEQTSPETGPRRPDARRGLLAGVLALAAFACAERAEAQNQAQQDWAHANAEQSDDGVGPERRINRRLSLRMHMRVGQAAERMATVARPTFEAIARELDAQGSPVHASVMRRANNARRVNDLLNQGRRSEVPFQVSDVVFRARGENTTEVVSLQDAFEAFEEALHARDVLDAEGRPVALASVVLRLLGREELEADQAREVLRSGLFTDELQRARERAAQQPERTVNLREVFTQDELRVFASYADHLNDVDYWNELNTTADPDDQTPAVTPLTGADILRTQSIPLSYGYRLLASVDAIGQLSRWDRMTWAGGSEEIQHGSALANVDVSLKLAMAVGFAIGNQITPEYFQNDSTRDLIPRTTSQTSSREGAVATHPSLPHSYPAGHHRHHRGGSHRR